MREFFIKNGKVIGWILVFVFGSGVIYKVIDLYQGSQPPQFSISAINTLDGGNRYEIGNHLIWTKEIPGVKLNWGLEVNPNYHGNPIGEVQVRVLGSGDRLLAINSWQPFTKDSQPLRIELEPSVLLEQVESVVYSQEAPGDMFIPETEFLIEIVDVRNPSRPLYTDTLTIINTPFSNSTKIYPYFLWETNQSIDIYITGKNHGDPSEFIAITEVYELSDITGKPFEPWPKIGWNVIFVDGVIQKDGEFLVHTIFPDDSQVNFKFEPGKCYTILTYIIKKQNYVEFLDESWEESVEIWRFANYGDYNLVCYPTY